MTDVSVCLWFDGQAQEAATFYTGLVPGSRITEVTHMGDTALTVAFELGGRPFLALNGGPTYALTPAASIVLTCPTQDEIDHYWAALTEGGEESRCGWLVDRFGLSWQVVPEGLGELLSGGGDAARAARVTEALLAMGKLDLPALRAAYDAE